MQDLEALEDDDGLCGLKCGLRLRSRVRVDRHRVDAETAYIAAKRGGT